MSTARNHFHLIGNIGKDPELKHSSNGSAYFNSSIAVNKRIKDSEGNTKTITNWFNFTLWGKQAETLSKYIKKGSTVALSGEIKTEKRKVGDDEITVMALKVDNCEILGGGSKSSSSSEEDSDDLGFGNYDDITE